MRKFMITVNGSTYEVDVEEVQAGVAVTAAPAAPVAPAAAPAAPVPKAEAAAPVPTVPKPSAPVTGGEAVTAPMPGTILSVNVTVGQKVKKGDLYMVLEAMKMENEIVAARDGEVAHVAVQKGSTVNAGDLLLQIK